MRAVVEKWMKLEMIDHASLPVVEVDRKLSRKVPPEFGELRRKNEENVAGSLEKVVEALRTQIDRERCGKSLS